MKHRFALVAVLASTLLVQSALGAEDLRKQGLYVTLGAFAGVGVGHADYDVPATVYAPQFSFATNNTFPHWGVDVAIGWHLVPGLAVGIEGNVMSDSWDAAMGKDTNLSSMAGYSVGPLASWFPWEESPCHFRAGVGYARFGASGSMDKLNSSSGDGFVDLEELGGRGVRAHGGLGYRLSRHGYGALALEMSVLHVETSASNMNTVAIELHVLGGRF